MSEIVGLTSQQQSHDSSSQINRPISETPSQYTTEILNPGAVKWEEIREDILRIQSEFNWKASEESLQSEIMNPTSTTVLLRKQGSKRILGYTYAVSKTQRETTMRELISMLDEDSDLAKYLKSAMSGEQDAAITAYIKATALDANFRGQGLVSIVMKRLEDELVKKNYKYMERDATWEYDYAKKIRKQYGDRIVYSFDHAITGVPQTFFRIKLPEQPS